MEKSLAILTADTVTMCKIFADTLPMYKIFADTVPTHKTIFAGNVLFAGTEPTYTMLIAGLGYKQPLKPDGCNALLGICN